MFIYIYYIYIWGKCSNKHVKFWFVFKTSYAFGHWNYVRSEFCLVQYLDLLDSRAHKKQTHLFGLAKRGIPVAKKTHHHNYGFAIAVMIIIQSLIILVLLIAIISSLHPCQ